MELNTGCKACLTRKWLGKCPPEASAEAAEAYRAAVEKLVEADPRATSPEVDRRLSALRAEMFGAGVDYGPIKRHFNALLMAMEPELYERAMSAEQPLRRAVQYAMTGNFVDFAALDSVDENKLRELLAGAGDIPVADGVLDQLQAAVAGAGTVAYILDNCGEIAMDRVLMRVLKTINPAMKLIAVVKGGDVVNDATREDAEQANLSAVVDGIVDTGCAIAGVPERHISPTCREALNRADVLISKGQANYETLCGCGLNLYYIFMCKCRLFMDRFGVPQFSGLLVRERDGAA